MPVGSDTPRAHVSREALDAGLYDVRMAPSDEGVLELIVRRPAVGARETLEQGELTTEDGLVGDTWKVRRESRASNSAPNPDMQLNVMSSRAAQLVAQDRSRWGLAGDQLYVDLDLSAANLPPGTQLALGSAVIEVTAEPHTGCGKFVSHFGVDAMKFVNSPQGRKLNLRGIHARVVRAGTIRTGDTVRKLQR